MPESEVWKLIKKFVGQNKGTITWYILFSALGHAIETLLIPRLLAKIFTEVHDMKALKKNIFFFLIVFVVEKIFYLASTYVNKRIEPTLTSFLSVEFIDAIFIKYENTHQPIDVAVTMEKITIVRQLLEDLIYYVYKLIPIILVLVTTIITVFVLNVKLGLFVLTSIIALAIIIVSIPKPKDNTKEKDAMYVYLEDIFQNMEIISSNEGGMPTAKRGINSRIKDLGRSRIKTGNKVGFNQGVGYLVSTILYIVSIIFLYQLYRKGEISTKNFEAYILTLGHLFKLAYDISYYLPDFMRGIQMIMLHSLMSYFPINTKKD
jgi:ABC-type multidrug transport system fused ATPase/permease subunit